jgi:hypothetical protein
MPDALPPPTDLFPPRPLPSRAWHPGAITVEEVIALVDCASGADTAAIQALESIVADLHRAADARDFLAAHLPPELLRQVLLARSTTQPPGDQPSTGPAPRAEGGARS